MDGRTTYSKLKKLIETISEETISSDELRTLLIMNIGSDNRTVDKCVRLMDITGLIEDIGNTQFKIKK